MRSTPCGSAFLTAAVAALAQWLVAATPIFSAMVQALFQMAKLSVEVMVLLFGTLTLWLGFCALPRRRDWWTHWRVGWRRCFAGSCLGYRAATRWADYLNFAANALGLDNAATPMGLKGMKACPGAEPQPGLGTATNAQILFLVLSNASSLTLRRSPSSCTGMQQGAPDPL